VFRGYGNYGSYGGELGMYCVRICKNVGIVFRWMEKE
jgi:hypothetical protein